MNEAAGWKGDVSPTMAITVMAVLMLGVPAAFVLALIGAATAIGLVVW